MGFWDAVILIALLFFIHSVIRGDEKHDRELLERLLEKQARPTEQGDTND